jgi:hypothetical protein
VGPREDPESYSSQEQDVISKALGTKSTQRPKVGVVEDITKS